MSGKKIVLCVLALCILCLSGGCSKAEKSNSGAVSYNRIPELTKEYIIGKYGETPQVGAVMTYKDSYNGKGIESQVEFKGYAIETDDYMTFISFTQDGSCHFSDDRQAEEIERDMQEELKKCYGEEAYLSMSYMKDYSPNDGAAKEPYAASAATAYTEYYDGDLQKLFSRDSQEHRFIIYVPSTADDEAVVKKIAEHFKTINRDGSVYSYEKGIYDTLKPFFDDYDYMSPYLNRLYYTARTVTSNPDDVSLYELQKITDGIYAKCDAAVKMYEPQKGLEIIGERYKDDAIADYLPNGSEKYVFVADKRTSIWLIIDSFVINGEYEFVMYDNADISQLCSIEYDEVLSSISKMSGKAYYVNAPWGYSVMRGK